METKQALADKWDEVRTRLIERWNKLSEEDLRQFDGNLDQLIGRIQRKTGESREAISKFLDQISANASDAADGVRQRIRTGAAQVSAAAEDGYEALGEGYAEAERIVQERPGQAMAVAFGLGVLAGVGAVLLLRDRQPEPMMARSRAVTEHLGKQILDALSSIVPRG